MSSGIYSTKNPELGDLGNVATENISNNDIIQYDSVSTNWQNKSDFTIDEIDARVLRVSETADIGGRLACVGVASFVNDEFVLQNGTSNLGDVVYIDNVNNRVGINISDPEEDFEVDGSIQIDSANIARLKFQQSGPDPHALGEIDSEQDGTNGGDLQFFTKVDGGSVTEKLRINNVGAIGLGNGEEKFGIAGSIFTSNGEGTASSWNAPYYFKAEMSANQTSTTQNTDIDLNKWTASLPSPYNGNNSDLTSVTEWTAPANGLYAVCCRLNMYNGNDFLRKAIVRLNKDSGSGYSVVASGVLVVSIADTTDIVTAQPTFYDLIPMDAGDTFKISFEYNSNGGGLTIFAGTGSAWTITKVV